MNRDGVAVMAIEGKQGASNGFAYGPLGVSTDRYRTLRLKLSGTGNARFFVDVMAPDGSCFLSSRWIDSPQTTEERTFALPAGKQVGQIVLYTWTGSNPCRPLTCPPPNRAKPTASRGSGSNCPATSIGRE